MAKNETNNKAYLPTNDYIFKRLFGHEGNEKITKDLLEKILNTKVGDDFHVEPSKVLEKDLKDDKIGVLDISATFGNSQADVEMQVVEYDDLIQRMLKYWSTLYNKVIKAGNDYSLAKRTIVIFITEYDFKTEVPKFHSSWHIREDDFQQIVLTNLLEFHIISIERFEKMQAEGKVKDAMLATWLKFIRNPNLLEAQDMEDDVVKEAKEKYDEIVADEHERYLAEQRLIRIMDEKSIRRSGVREGMEKGMAKRNIEIAKNLLKENIPIDIISKATELTKEEIEKLSEE